jgi:hypothetical protein
LHLADIDLRSKREISKHNAKHYPQNRRHTLNQYEWIEKLLVTPISDYRKCTIDLILAPYLIVIKEHLEKNAFEKIMYWTEKCNGLRSLSPSPYHFENKTRAAVQNSLQRKIPQITLTNLKLKYPDWFGTLDNCDIIG